MKSEPRTIPERAGTEAEAFDSNPGIFELEIEELESRVAFTMIDGGGGSSCVSCGGSATCRGGTACP